MTARAKSMMALQIANVARSNVARAKRELGQRRRTLEDVLRDPACESARVLAILAAQPYWGPVKAGGLMDQLKIHASRRVGELTDRQIALIAKSAQLRTGDRWQVIAEEIGVAA